MLIVCEINPFENNNNNNIEHWNGFYEEKPDHFSSKQGNQICGSEIVVSSSHCSLLLSLSFLLPLSSSSSTLSSFSSSTQWRSCAILSLSYNEFQTTTKNNECLCVEKIASQRRWTLKIKLTAYNLNCQSRNAKRVVHCRRQHCAGHSCDWNTRIDPNIRLVR